MGPRSRLYTLRTLRVGGLVLAIASWGPPNLAAPAPMPSLPPQQALLAADPLSRGVMTMAVPSPLSALHAVSGPSLLDLPTATPPAHEWRLIGGKHWQIVAPAGEDTAVTDAAENTRGACRAGMVEVTGKMKLSFMLDEMQQNACTKWISRSFPERCADFDRDQWLAMSKDLPTKQMHFCIDRFEYPNKKGEYPIILVNWYEANDRCAAEGKRLCTESEWTFACEGEEATPYPNGYIRDAATCVMDRPWKQFDDAALVPRDGAAAGRELERLWQGVASGTRPACKSAAGVYDMTGNVDEWTRSSVPGERPSVLKGGYWGPVRTRCSPATRAHGETHTFYQQGLRCCGGL